MITSARTRQRFLRVRTPRTIHRSRHDRSIYAKAVAERRWELSPGQHEAFHEFSRPVFADGALDSKSSQLVAVPVAPVTQCPY